MNHSVRPSFDDALVFWRELLHSRGLPGRLTWLFSEDVVATDDGDVLQPRSEGAGEWLARRAYAAAPASEILMFAAYASAHGNTITGLASARSDAGADVRRDDWNLLFDASSRLSERGHLLALTPLRERLTDTDRIALRREALRDLVLFVSPIASVQRSLRDFARDSDELSMLEKQHVLSVLKRFEDGEIAAADVEAWANVIELRDDVGYDRETAVWDVLYELANPTLTEILSRERADVLASVLKGY